MCKLIVRGESTLRRSGKIEYTHFHACTQCKQLGFLSASLRQMLDQNFDPVAIMQETY